MAKHFRDFIHELNFALESRHGFVGVLSQFDLDDGQHRESTRAGLSTAV